MLTCCAGFLKRHSPQPAWMLAKRRRSRTGCPMARGRNAAPKKSETSSSVSEGWVWEVSSQKGKTGFNGRNFNHQNAVDMHFMGVLPRRFSEKWPALNAGGPLSFKTRGLTPTKNTTPLARGYTRSGHRPFSVHGVPITGGSGICKM